MRTDGNYHALQTMAQKKMGSLNDARALECIVIHFSRYCSFANKSTHTVSNNELRIIFFYFTLEVICKYGSVMHHNSMWETHRYLK